MKRLARDEEVLNILRHFCNRYFKTLDIRAIFVIFRRLEACLEQISSELQILSAIEETGPEYGFHRAVSCKESWSGLKSAAMLCSKTLADLAKEISVVLEAISYKDEDFTESNLYSQGNRYIGVCKSWADILSDCFKQESDDCCYHVQYGDKANQATGLLP